MENDNVWNAYTPLSIKSWWQDSSLSVEHEQFFKDIDQALLNVTDIPLCKSNLVKALENWCTDNHKTNRTFKLIKQLLKRLDQSFLLRGLFSKSLRYYKKTQIRNLTEVAKMRSKDGTLIDQTQLNAIINLITSSHQNG